MEPYTLDDLHREIALMRAEQEFFTLAILTVVSTIGRLGDPYIVDNTTWAVNRAKELAAQKVASHGN